MRGFFGMPNAMKKYGRNKKRPYVSKSPHNSYLTGLGSKREIVHEQPIVVDLTNDDVKLRQEKSEMSANSSEVCAMIADSSSKFNRDNKRKNGIAKALGDRGACVIPVQPNHCLPIHPAPPIPTRAVPIPTSRKSLSPVFKLAIENSILDAVDVEPINKLRIFQVNADSEEEQSVTFIHERNQEGKTSSKETNHYPIKIQDPVKRKITSDKFPHERGKDATKDSKKKKESVYDGFNELYTNATGNIDKEGNVKVLNGTKCTTSIVGSTTEIDFGKEKIVPPLRLKKIVQEGKNGGNAEIALSIEKEANYRIITGATPSPDSESIPTVWTTDYHSDNNSNFDVASTSSTPRNIVHRSSLKSDDYKLQYRRNRLRRKLKELQDKALDLSREISVNKPSIVDSSPQRNTRLRQMMNCYEKQIENISKLLKLYNVNPLANEFVDLEENKREYRRNEELIRNFSPISSPEPPKLSPRSSIDYPNKSPDTIRNTPPVLPKVSINISSNLDTLDKHDAETVQLPEESTWIACDNSVAEISSMANTFGEDTANQEWESNNNIIDLGHRSTTPPIPSSTSIDLLSSENVENIENGQIFFDNIGEIVEKDNIKMVHEKRETVKELTKAIEIGQSSNNLITKKKTEIKKQEARDPDSVIKMNLFEGPIISSVSGGSDIPRDSRCDQVNDATQPMLPIMKTPISTSADMMNILQLEPHYYGSTLVKKNSLETNQIEGSKKVQKVPSSTTQSRKTDDDSIAPTYSQVEYPFMDHHCPAQSSNDNRIMTEQFPTLGNWVAKMSKKQVSKQKSKLHNMGNSIGTIPTEESVRNSGLEAHKVSSNDTNNTANCNSVLNLTTSQSNRERWHRQHHQQRQQQQLFQHVATGTNSQSLPSTTLNSGMCTPHSTTHFYPNNYNIDPYNGATFGYHSALYPVYGSYPYHSRLHPGISLTNYHHIPMQNPLNSPLRPLPSHIDKQHLTSLQNTNRNFTSDIFKYSGSFPAAAECQPSNNFGFDRLRTATSTNNHTDEASCLSSLLLTSSALSSGVQQTLPRMPLNGYQPNNNQYGRNRIIPDVVAAAAAAAVVAAASIGSQHTSLTPYSKSGSTAMNAPVMEIDSTRLTSNTSNNHTREHLLSHQGQSVDVRTKEPQWNRAECRSLPNLLLERLPYIRPEHNTFPTTSTHSSNIQNPPQTVPLPQISKKMSRSVERDCETPHLGKVNRSPNTLINLKCSNCGIAGSMFKCLGCELAFYCNERCQAQHWSIHVEKCPKKMPKLKKVA